MKKYWVLALYKHPADWFLFPWLETHESGWHFTWLFFGVGKIYVGGDVQYLGEEDE